MRKFDVIAAKERISKLRNELQLSQEELGGRFGMSRAGYSAAENPLNDKVFFTPVQLINLKYELKSCHDYLLEGIGNRESNLVKLTSDKIIETPINELEKYKMEILHLKDKIAMQQLIIDSLTRENAMLRK